VLGEKLHAFAFKQRQKIEIINKEKNNEK